MSLGRASHNDVVLEDASVSRSHARLIWKAGTILLEDLGSRNGCTVNDQRISGPHPVKPGDVILLGAVPLRLEDSEFLHPLPLVVRDDPTDISLILKVDQLRDLRPDSQDPSDSNRWREALAVVHELSLELMGNEPVELMLWSLLERLFALMKPRRGAVLLKDATGQLNQVAARSSSQGRQFQVRLSRTMIDAAMERREALLINYPLNDDRLGQAPSMVFSGTSTLMTVPLEHEGEVVGLVYLDRDLTREFFTEEELRIVASLCHLAAAKIRQAGLMERARKARDMEKELSVARQIQERILPDRPPQVDGFEIFGTNVSCKQVSGDLFGYWPRPDGKLWLAIADVSGKGLGPGLLMATFQAYMQAWSETYVDPAALASKLSTSLSKKTTMKRFITAFLALLDPVTHTLEFTNAGHNPILLLRADGRRELLVSKGFPLALFAGTPYARESRTLEPGDLLCLYTDGISEAEDDQGREFELEGIESVLRTHGSLPLDELYREIHEALDRHTKGAPLLDDRTLLILRRSSASASGLDGREVQGHGHPVDHRRDADRVMDLSLR